MDGVLRMKQIIYENRNLKNVLMEISPLNKIDFGEDLEKKDENLVKKLTSQSDYFIKKSKKDFENFLEENGKIRVLDQTLSREFIEQIRKNKSKEYKVSESERIIYYEENLLAQPHEFFSLIYYLSESKKAKNCKIGLIDTDKAEEIYLLALKYSLQEI